MNEIHSDKIESPDVLESSTIGETIPLVGVSAKRLQNIPSKTYNGISCSNAGGISLGKANGRLFAVKQGQDTEAVLYYFPSFNGTTRKAIHLHNYVGHANGMALDANYIYITAWKNDSAGTNGSVIKRISRSGISATADGGAIPSNSSYVTSMNVTYSAANGITVGGPITAITKYTGSNFIVRCKVSYPNQSTLNASITENGIIYYPHAIARPNSAGTGFTVSANDVFLVRNTVGTSTTGQDIYYKSGFGLFVPRWKNQTQNTVLRVDIDNGTPYTVLGKFTAYTPRESVAINGSSPLTKFEIESIAITGDNKVLLGCNIEGGYKDGVLVLTDNTILPWS